MLTLQKGSILITMDLALKKIELINWLSHLQNEKVINKVEALRKESVKNIFEEKGPKTLNDLEKKLKKSTADIEEGRIYLQEDVETYFKAKYKHK